MLGFTLIRYISPYWLERQWGMIKHLGFDSEVEDGSQSVQMGCEVLYQVSVCKTTGSVEIGQTPNGSLDVPSLNIPALGCILIEQHKAQGDIWRVLDGAERNLGRLRRVQPKDSIGYCKLKVFFTHQHISNERLAYL